MLTITQDWIMTDAVVMEYAQGGDLEVFAETRATCVLAAALLRQGYDSDTKVTLVRADPWLFPAPHRIAGVSLLTVSTIDFFQTCPDVLRRDFAHVENDLRTPL